VRELAHQLGHSGLLLLVLGQQLQAMRPTLLFVCHYHTSPQYRFTLLLDDEQHGPPKHGEHEQPEDEHQDITPSSAQFDATGLGFQVDCGHW
jgi:hypothetical protein